MGEDFLRKTERSYRRSLQRTVERRLITPPLLATPETARTSYPCRLADPAIPLNADAPFLLHRRQDRNIEILDAHTVIGSVHGDARQDLNDYLDARGGCADLLRIQPGNNDGAYLDFTINEDEQ